MTEAIERTETITAGPAEALAGLLGVEPPRFSNSADLPLLWHWVYLLDRVAESELGIDGHPTSGALPPPPGPGLRRLFAGGRVKWLGHLQCGASATRRSTVIDIQHKEGRAGQLTFVTVGHQIFQNAELVIEEQQDIVYLHPSDIGTPSESVFAAERRGDHRPPCGNEWRLDITPTLLFRFSALTYNAHRIHYDRDYARDIEGYPGLVTHGPLQALMMVEAARRYGFVATGRASFDYRLIAPLFDYQGLVASVEISGVLARSTIRDLSGRMTAWGTLIDNSART